MKKLSFVSFLLGFLLLWGCAETPLPDPEESLRSEISNNSTEESYGHGTVVASVGNDYHISGQIQYYPAAYDSVLAVGSLNSEQSEISEFSQRGSWVDVYAVGEEITIGTLSGNTRVSEGTSYSAARVTAYAGKLLQEDAGLTVQELRQLVVDGAKVLPDGTKYIP